MKRFLAITMLFLFLLNVLGYYGVLVGLRIKNVHELVQKIDNNAFQSSETITFKVPVAVPYYTDSRDFERVDGEFEHNGEVYRMVKQRLHQDTLSIVCLKDAESRKINSALADYVKTFTDKQENSKQGVKALQLIKDYISFTITIDHNSAGWESLPAYSIKPQNLIPSFCSTIVHPPERA